MCVFQSLRIRRVHDLSVQASRLRVVFFYPPELQFKCHDHGVFDEIIFYMELDTWSIGAI